MSNKSANMVFGIDLGTTYSCIAYIDTHGEAVVIPNSEGEKTTPSVVRFEENKIIVGKEPKESAIVYPETTIEMVKRNMGDPNWNFKHKDHNYSATQISSLILKKLAQDAEKFLGIPVKNVVISCPAYFGIAERNATKEAGEIAGLNVLEIINEPTAAAINYGLQKGHTDQTVLVYDLGGGTFDITMIKIEKGDITAIVTGGSAKLGGRNWDNALVDYADNQWRLETGHAQGPLSSPNTHQALLLRAERAKQELSEHDQTQLSVTHMDEMVIVPLTRDLFDKQTRSLLEQTLFYTKITLKKAANKGVQAFDRILLVGGSTKMLQVAAALKIVYKQPIQIFEPDEAVAKGAALYGQQLPIPLDHVPESDNFDRVPHTFTPTPTTGRRITNVASHSFGIIAVRSKATQGRKIISNLILANDPLPIKKVETFGTIVRNQQSVILRIMEVPQAEREIEPEDYTDDSQIGEAILDNLPPGLPEGSAIQVTFELTKEGNLYVEGYEPRGKRLVKANLKIRGGMSKEELDTAKIYNKNLFIE